MKSNNFTQRLLKRIINKIITVKTVIYFRKIIRKPKNANYLIFTIFVKIFYFRIHGKMILKCGNTFGTATLISFAKNYCRIYFEVKIFKKILILKCNHLSCSFSAWKDQFFFFKNSAKYNGISSSRSLQTSC